MKHKFLQLVLVSNLLLLHTNAGAALADERASNTSPTTATQVLTEPDASTWKAWHKAVADELFQRIKDLLVKIGPPETEREFYGKIHWRINPDGRIILLKIDGPQSHLFRDVIRSAVDSMKSSENLKFPEGSTKPYVQKISEVKFWWNPNTSSYDLFEPDNDTR